MPNLDLLRTLTKIKTVPSDHHASNHFYSICELFFHHENMLYNFDPLKPHFYIGELGFTGVYIIFLILLKIIDSNLIQYLRTDVNTAVSTSALRN